MRCEAQVAELADALDSKSSDRKVVWVQLPPWAPFESSLMLLFWWELKAGPPPWAGGGRAGGA